MTVAKPNLLRARTLLLEHLNRHAGAVAADLEPAEVGIVGGPAHVAAGTSYHLGRDQLRLSARPYSVYESPRDRNGLDEHASAMDIGQFEVTTSRDTFTLVDFSRWLVGLCAAGDPDTADIREVIYSPDGRTVKRWDRLKIRTSGDDSHRWHTHVSEFRDATGHRMIRLVGRWLTHIGLLEGDDMTREELLATELSNGMTINNALVTLLLRTPTNVHARLDAILAAAVDDGNTTVTMSVDDRAALAAQLAEAIDAPSVADVRDAVADLGEGGAAQVRAG
jgi:hypothetical protein